jgi:ankyrin repeat protein
MKRMILRGFSMMVMITPAIFTISLSSVYSDIPSLVIAVQGDSCEEIEHLIKTGANVNEKDEHGATPLIHAAIRKNEKIIEILLKNGADINARDKTGRTALLYAVAAGYDRMSEILVVNGADVNIADKDSMTPLYFAVDNGNIRIAKLLMSKRVDPNVRITTNNYLRGSTALLCAIAKNNRELVELLVKHDADTNFADFEGGTALMLACRKGDLHTVIMLLDAGAKINIAYNMGNTPLIYASLMGGAGIVEFLIDKGADPYVKNGEGVSAFSIISEYAKSVESYKRLMKKIVRERKS